MEHEYFDCVILGTGIQQCIPAETLSKNKYKTIQLDRNTTYGGDLRTLRYTDLLNSEKNGVPELLQHDRKFNIDLVPKFLLADGLMKDLMVEHEIHHLVEFVDVQGSFVYQNGVLHVVPTTEKASFTSGLISLLQKPRVAKFFWSVRKYCEMKQSIVDKICKKCNEGFLCSGKCAVLDENCVSQGSPNVITAISESEANLPNSEESKTEKFTYNNQKMKIELATRFKFTHDDMQKELEDFSLSKKSIEIIGHAISLNLDNKYLQMHPVHTYDKIYFYVKSLISLSMKTPFIYPLYGLSEICHAFTRRAGGFGCIFMLNTPILRIKKKCGPVYEQVDNLEDFFIETEVEDKKILVIEKGFCLESISNTLLEFDLESVKEMKDSESQIDEKKNENFEENKLNDKDDSKNKEDKENKLNDKDDSKNKEDEENHRNLDPHEHKLPLNIKMESKEHITHSIIHDTEINTPHITTKKNFYDASSPIVDYTYEIIIKDNINNKVKKLLTNKIISDSTYFPNNTTPYQEIITCICIVKGPIKLVHQKCDISSAHIIFLSSDMHRKNDIFMAVLSERESVCPKGYSIAIISTIRETMEEPLDEIKSVISLMNANIVDKFVRIRQCRKKSFGESGVVMTNDVDQTTHFESLYDDIQRCLLEIGDMCSEKIVKKGSEMFIKY